MAAPKVAETTTQTEPAEQPDFLLDRILLSRAFFCFCPVILTQACIFSHRHKGLVDCQPTRMFPLLWKRHHAKSKESSLDQDDIYFSQEDFDFKKEIDDCQGKEDN